jgi:hypothetical protein
MDLGTWWPVRRASFAHGIDGSDSAQAPTAFLEIISDDSPILHTQRSHHAAWVIFIIAATFFQLMIRNQHRQLAKDSRGLVATDQLRQDNPCPLLD